MNEHWLLKAAGRAGHTAATPVSVPPGTLLPEAWAMVGRGLGLTDDQLAAAVARAFRLQVASLDHVESRATRLVPERIAREYRMLGIRESDREIVVATSDPTNQDAEQ